MKFAILLFICSMVLSTASCNKKSAESTSQAHVKPFHLKGKVVSIDNRAQMVNVDSETIPGFMDASTMPYKVKPESELGKLHPGDVITATLLVQDDGAWLEDITVTSHSSAGENK
jgi:Cu/Ag efflux protein CusF